MWTERGRVCLWICGYACARFAPFTCVHSWVSVAASRLCFILLYPMALHARVASFLPVWGEVERCARGAMRYSEPYCTYIVYYRDYINLFLVLDFISNLETAGKFREFRLIFNFRNRV